MSGSGKSYMEQELLFRLILADAKNYQKGQNGEYFFCDYKCDSSFAYLMSEGSPRYFAYTDTLQAIDLVHSHLMARQAGKESSKCPISLFIDEYMALILNLMGTDKKKAAEVSGKISQILLLGRSPSVRLAIFCQRPDAVAFSAGSRLNFGNIIILGSAAKSIYEMLMPDFMDELKGRRFGRGEGVVLLQGADLRFIKVPTVRDEETV